MTMHKELVVSLSELQHVCVTCPHCSTRVIFSLKAAVNDERLPMRSIEDRPSDAVLELLQHCVGTIQ